MFEKSVGVLSAVAWPLGMLKKSHEVARHNLESTLPQKCNGTKKIRKFGRAWIWEQFLLCSKLKCFEFSRQNQFPSRSIFICLQTQKKQNKKRSWHLKTEKCFCLSLSHQDATSEVCHSLENLQLVSRSNVKASYTTDIQKT